MTVLDWLLDSDPSIRWQVMRDLLDAPAEEVPAEMDDAAGQPSRWNTLRAMRVLRWWAAGSSAPASLISLT